MGHDKIDTTLEDGPGNVMAPGAQQSVRAVVGDASTANQTRRAE